MQNNGGFGQKATYWKALKAEMQSRVRTVEYVRGNGGRDGSNPSSPSNKSNRIHLQKTIIWHYHNGYLYLNEINNMIDTLTTYKQKNS